MGIIRNFLRKWRERRDGTLEGPALRTEQINNTAHITAAASELKAKLQKHGANTRYEIHDKGDPYVFESDDLLHDEDVPSNIEIVGVGEPTITIADGVEQDLIRPALEPSDAITYNVTIRGINFDGNRANAGIKTERDPDGDGKTELKGTTAIRPVRASGWTVENCTFDNWARFGYCAKLIQGPMIVRDCDGTNNGDDAFTVSNQFFATQDPDEAFHLFETCHGYNNDDQALEFEDGACWGVARDCIFEDNDNNGATVKSHVQDEFTPQDEAPCRHIRFRNCEFRNNGNAGIWFNQSKLGDTVDIVVDEDCTFEDNGGANIKLGAKGRNGNVLRDVAVRGDVVLNGAANAVKTTIDGDPIEDLTIDLNVTVEDEAAIGEVIVDLRGCRIDDLTVDGDIEASGADLGIAIESANGPIKDIALRETLSVYGANGCGCNLQVRNSNPIERGTIAGTFKNNGQNTSNSDFDRAGVRILDATDLTVSAHAYDDQGTKTQVTGILHQGDYNLFDDCNVRGNATNAFAGSSGANSLKGTNIT